MFHIQESDDGIYFNVKHQQFPSNLNMTEFIEYLNSNIQKYNHISVDIYHNNIQHSFVLYSDNNIQNSKVDRVFIHDSYTNLRSLEVRLFPMDQFKSLLNNPTVKNTMIYSTIKKLSILIIQLT